MTEKLNGAGPVVRTSAGLRDALFDALDGLRNGSTSANSANSIAKLADQVVQTVHMELAVQKHASTVKATATAPALPNPVELGKVAWRCSAHPATERSAA